MNRPRWKFAAIWALRHAVVSMGVALLSAFLVFAVWYPMPYRAMLGIGGIYLLILVVDVVCGPLLTLVLASPKKSMRELTLDLGLVALIQIAALVYGMHAVWIARPAVLAFEKDRLMVVTANEVDISELEQAPEGMRQLPFSGVLKVATRSATSGMELVESIDKGMAGISPAMLPSWWLPMQAQYDAMRARTKPLTELIARRPEHAELLKKAAAATSIPMEQLTYLPLTATKTKDWIALLNVSLTVVGFAPVDGF